jgi:hypothetical protein
MLRGYKQAVKDCRAIPTCSQQRSTKQLLSPRMGPCQAKFGKPRVYARSNNNVAHAVADRGPVRRGIQMDDPVATTWPPKGPCLGGWGTHWAPHPTRRRCSPTTPSGQTGRPQELGPPWGYNNLRHRASTSGCGPQAEAHCDMHTKQKQWQPQCTPDTPRCQGGPPQASSARIIYIYIYICV